MELAAEQSQIITSLFEGISRTDPSDAMYAEGIRITERDATIYPDEPSFLDTPYRVILGLERTPVAKDAKVLDVGTGNATIRAEDFGLSPGNLIRVDLIAKGEGLIRANVLQLPFKNGVFDEVWASNLLEYVECPTTVRDRLFDASHSVGLNPYTVVENFERYFSIKAISELLRVVKSPGRIRIASTKYFSLDEDLVRETRDALTPHEFHIGDNQGLQLLEIGISNHDIKGVTIANMEIVLPREDISQYAIDGFLFIEKTAEFSQEELDRYIERIYENLVPSILRQALLNL